MSHHATEDLAIMRALPGMVVVAPGDPLEAACATRAVAAYDGPCYLRLGRAGESVVHHSEIDFRLGKATVVRDGTDLSLISTGAMLAIPVQFAERLVRLAMRTRVRRRHTVKPLEGETGLARARDSG